MYRNLLFGLFLGAPFLILVATIVLRLTERNRNNVPTPVSLRDSSSPR